MSQESVGYKKDDGKDRMDLIPPEAIFALARVMTAGTKIYEERNWEKGMRWGRMFGACMRHLWAWWAGEKTTSENFALGPLDQETGLSHLWHALFCLVVLVTYEERKIGEDDRSSKSR